MKRSVIILLLLVLSTTASFAQNMLKVSTSDKAVINVSVDGRYFNKSGTSVTVGDLPPGRHFLQIYTGIQDASGGLRQTMIYDGKVKIHPGMILLFVLDAQSDQPMIQEQDINSYVNNNPLPPYTPNSAAVNNTNVAPDNGSMGNNNGNNNNGNNNDDNSQVASPISAESVSTLTGDRMTEVKAQADAKKTDTDKMKVIKDELKNERISVDQIATMMAWLSFESTKLDFVEWAYNITADKENFGSLDNKFTFKNYQDDFRKFVTDKK